MGEILSHEAQLQALQFGQEVTKRGLSIGEKRATEFAEFLLKRDAPDGLLDRLASVVGFIDQQTLHIYLQSLAEQAKQIVGDNSYYLALHDTGRSGQWVYENLRKLGLPPAKICFAQDKVIEKGAKIDEKPVISFRKMNDLIQENAIVLVVDDWAFQSQQMDDVLSLLPDDCRPHALLLAATTYAREKMKEMREDVIIHTARPENEDIPMLDNVLTEEDITFLESLYTKTKGDINNQKLGFYNTLFASVHKTPDNIPDIFTGQRRLRGRRREVVPPLILPVKPPYEK